MLGKEHGWALPRYAQQRQSDAASSEAKQRQCGSKLRATTRRNATAWPGEAAPRDGDAKQGEARPRHRTAGPRTDQQSKGMATIGIAAPSKGMATNREAVFRVAKGRAELLMAELCDGKAKRRPHHRAGVRRFGWLTGLTSKPGRDHAQCESARRMQAGFPVLPGAVWNVQALRSVHHRVAASLTPCTQQLWKRLFAFRFHDNFLRLVCSSPGARTPRPGEAQWPRAQAPSLDREALLH